MDVNPMNAGIVHNYLTPYNKRYNKPRRVVFITLLTTSYIVSILYVWYSEVMYNYYTVYVIYFIAANIDSYVMMSSHMYETCKHCFYRI